MSGDITKEKILQVALKLFSSRGFTAVSIRDICVEVRIKESSIYYHFTNKRAILQELQRRFESIAEKLMQQLQKTINSIDPNMPLFHQNVTDAFLEQYLLDDFCNRFMRLMVIEQFHDTEIRGLSKKWLFDEPLRIQSEIFTTLLDRKILYGTSSAELAIRYYAPIFFWFQRDFLVGTPTTADKIAFREKVSAHLANFFKEYGKETRCQ